MKEEWKLYGPRTDSSEPPTQILLANEVREKAFYYFRDDIAFDHATKKISTAVVRYYFVGTVVGIVTGFCAVYFF